MDTQTIDPNVLNDRILYLEQIQMFELRKELERCPEKLSDWLLEEGLKFLVAKNYLEVDVTDKGNNGYIISNAGLQMLDMDRNHLCSADTAEHHS